MELATYLTARFFLDAPIFLSNGIFANLTGPLVQLADLNDQQFISDLVNRLRSLENINPLDLPNDQLKAYCRGIVDACCFIALCEENWVLNVPIRFAKLFEKLGTCFENTEQLIVYRGPNAFEIICILYGDASVWDKTKAPYPRDIITEVKGINTAEIPRLRVFRKDPTAILPTKSKETDIGWDITVIGEFKRYDCGTMLLETGLIVQVHIG